MVAFQALPVCGEEAVEQLRASAGPSTDQKDRPGA